MIGRVNIFNMAISPRFNASPMKVTVGFFVYLFFKTGLRCVAKAGLEFVILLPQLPE
jgi:hypothetical protein